MKAGVLKRESLDDARARFKHQSLLQDYQELQKETEVARTRLKSVKDRKLTLEAEVRCANICLLLRRALKKSLFMLVAKIS
ncbi:hypothetical protein QQ045_002537 [Rhodiola kirilowii]